MRIRAFLFTLWIFIAVGSSELESQGFDHDLFDLASLDPSPMEGMKPVLSRRMMFNLKFLCWHWRPEFERPELDSNYFFDDNVDLDIMSEPDSTFAFDSNKSCDFTSLDDFQLIGKVRRETSCKSPEGQAQKPNDFDNHDPFDFNQFVRNQALRIFPKFVEICPIYRFGTSNTPVCKDTSNGDIIRVPGVLPVTLLNIDPCMFVLFLPFGGGLW